MRSVSLVEKLEFDFKGSLFKNAICLVDIDGDGGNELCVCNTNGDLAVFKGNMSQPWRIHSNMGCVVVLCHGNFRCGTEQLLCSIDTQGWAHLMTVEKEDEDGLQDMAGGQLGSSPSTPTNSRRKPLKVLHKQKLSPNAKVAIVEDIDNDGVDELIVGFTDRNVRIYKWGVDKDSSTDSSPISQPLSPVSTSSRGTLAKKDSMNSENTDKKSSLSFNLQLSSTRREDSHSSSTDASKDRTDSMASAAANENLYGGGQQREQAIFEFDQEAIEQSLSGKFFLFKKLSLLEQIGSLALCVTSEGTQQLIASQPNGGYCILATYDHGTSVSELDTPISIDSPRLSQWARQDSFQTFYPIPTPKSRSSNINTEILGGIRRQDRTSGVMALCTHTGAYMILDNSSSVAGEAPKKQKSDHRWFTMSRFDVTQDGNDEIVLCSMDGMTYMIDRDREILSYNFKDNVSAFIAGYYCVDGVSNPCLVYVTLSGKIFVFHKVHAEAMKVQCVHGALIDKLKTNPKYEHILNALRLPNGEIDHLKIQRLVTQVWSAKIT